jgi:hypothetical protein
MKNILRYKYTLGSITVLALFYAFSTTFSAKKVDFNTQTKPLFNSKGDFELG